MTALYPVEKRLLTLKEAAASLSISVDTLRRLISRGLIKTNRSTRRVLIAAAELDKFANGGSR